MYLRKLPAAFAAATLLLAAPVSAQSEAESGGGGLWGGNTFGIVLGALASGAFIYGLVELIDDDDDNPVSP